MSFLFRFVVICVSRLCIGQIPKKVGQLGFRQWFRVQVLGFRDEGWGLLRRS